jgi:DNA-binding beta-propeller fold protein YncE
MRSNLLACAVTAVIFLTAAWASAQPAPVVTGDGGAVGGAGGAAGQPAAGYKVITTNKVGGQGGYDYVYADSDGRRLYIPRGDRITVYDLDTLKPAGMIADTHSVHGAAVDPKTGHGFSSSSPVVMWDAKTLATLKTIPVEGRPDGILFDPASGRVFVFSHQAPNVTAIDAKDGTVVGTSDLGGAPEQAVSDGKGHVYVDMEDKDQIAVLDASTLKVTAHYALGDKGGTPAGLAMDVKNRLLFVACRKPQTMVVMGADDGKVLAALPIGDGTDGAAFNPNTMEAFSSQRDGTLTVIKEASPTSFVVTQNVKTKPGARTLTLDPKTNQVFLITAEQVPFTQPAGGAPGGRQGRPAMVPDSFMILVVGK